MAANDRAAVVVYDNEAQVLVPSRTVESDVPFRSALRGVGSVAPSGGRFHTRHSRAVSALDCDARWHPVTRRSAASKTRSAARTRIPARRISAQGR